MIEKKTGKMVKRNLTKGRSMKPRPLLSNTERKYEYLCEKGSAIMLMIGADRIVKDVNNALLEMSGYSMDEIVGKNVLDFVVPEQRRKAAAQIQAALISGAAPQFEVAFRSKDGSTRTLLLPPKQLALEEKGQRSLLVMGVDITEHERAEEALVSERSKLEVITENIGAGLAIISKDYKTIWANRVLKRIFGDDVEGKTCYHTYNQRTEICPGCGVREIFEKGADHSVHEQVGKDAKGDTVWSQIIAGAIRNEEGKTTAALELVVPITERKRAEDRLRQSEERYRSLFDRMLDGIYRSTHEGRFIDVNPAFVKMFRYSSKQEMLDIADIKKELYFSPEERGSHILDTGQEEVEVYRMRRKDDSEMWVEDHGRYVHDEQGNIVYHEGILRDITDRTRTEKALRENEERFRKVFEEGPLGMALVQPDYHFARVNEAFCVTLGYSREELTTLKFTDITHPEDVKLGVELTEKMLRGEIPSFSVEKRYIKKNGEALSARLTASLIRDSNGIPLYSVAMIEDITERKRLEKELEGYSKHLEKLVEERTKKLHQSEESLRSTKERLEYVVESNPAVIYIAKPLPSLSDYYATYKSKNVALMTGFESEEFIGEKGAALWTSRVHPDDITSYREGEARFWKEGHRVCEYRFLHKNGTYRWIREEANLIRDSKGNVRDIIGYWTDITDHKQMEEELLRSLRLAAIGETASMVAHDLRNPLQAITGAIHLLKQELLTDKERDEMLRLIQDSVDYSESIVRDLFAYSAEIHLELSDTTPKSIVKEALGGVRVPREVTVQNASEEQPTLKVDSGRMRRVIINLIENAIDAMPQGGTLTISSKQSSGDVEIALTDTGSGMPEKVLENLWKPLQTTKAKGLGLGLAICKRIIDAHGGSISVKSKTGEGTTVTMQLPLRPVEVKQK